MQRDAGYLKSASRLGAFLGTAALALFLLPASTSPGVASATAARSAAGASARPPERTAQFGLDDPTPDVRWLADWVAATRDNGTSPFILVDKRAARLHVFDADARWTASTAVLLGAALGDDSVPGIGTRPIASIGASERTTPAGRFVGERGRNAMGEDIVWVDYDAAVSMHRVRLTNPSEHRAERLASPTATDNRISYGCINVPVAFYEQYIQTIFVREHAMIYVLPDAKPVRDVFSADAMAHPTGSASR